MPKFRIGALAVLLLASAGFAQDTPALSITPSQANVVVGESRRLRAVNSDGRPATSVRWDSDSPDTVISSGGPQIVVTFRQPGDYVIHAYSAEGSDSATIHVLPGATVPVGTEKWSVKTLPGCRAKKMVQAAAAPGSTTDLFMAEECQNGNLVRALTSDGLENWRKWITGDEGKDLDPEKLQASSSESTDLLHGSVCDSVKVGMARDDAMKLVVQAKLGSSGFDKSNDLWTLEEGTSECRITLHDGKVTKKQKIIGN